MANAFKCDRCKNLYGKYYGIKLTPQGARYTSIQLQGNGFWCDKDLCPDCMEKLISFIKMEEKEDGTI